MKILYACSAGFLLNSYTEALDCKSNGVTSATECGTACGGGSYTFSRGSFNTCICNGVEYCKDVNSNVVTYAPGTSCSSVNINSDSACDNACYTGSSDYAISSTNTVTIACICSGETICSSSSGPVVTTTTKPLPIVKCKDINVNDIQSCNSYCGTNRFSWFSGNHNECKCGSRTVCQDLPVDVKFQGKCSALGIDSQETCTEACPTASSDWSTSTTNGVTTEECDCSGNIYCKNNDGVKSAIAYGTFAFALAAAMVFV